jgi:hypothetical protein
MKNADDTIKNRTRDLPVCGAVSQQTLPPRAPASRNTFYGTLENDPNWLYVNTLNNEVCCVVTFYRPGNKSMNTYAKCKAIPVEAWAGPSGSRRLRLPELLDNRDMKVARLSAVHTGRLCQPRNIPGTYFC